MGKILMVLAVVGVLVIAGGAYFYFFYGDNTLEADLNEDEKILNIKGPSVDMKLDTTKIEKIYLDTLYGASDGDLISGSENAKIRSGTFKFGIAGMQCTANYHKDVSYRITVEYERAVDMPGYPTGRLVFNLDSNEKTEEFANALWTFTGAVYMKNGYTVVL